jgi:hypothetical protein
MFFPEYFGFPLPISFQRCSITWKNEKNWSSFSSSSWQVLHNKPYGCGTSVASAAVPFSTKKSLFKIITVTSVTVDEIDTWPLVPSFEAPPLAGLYSYWVRKWLIFLLTHRVVHSKVSYISEDKNCIVGVSRSRDNEWGGGGVVRGTHTGGARPLVPFPLSALQLTAPALCVPSELPWTKRGTKKKRIKN